MLAAEQDAAVPASPKKTQKLVPVALAVFLIILGGGGIFAAFYFTREEVPQETLGVPSLIFADEKMELTGPDYRSALADAANEILVPGNILVTYITEATTTPLGTRAIPQPGGKLIRALNLGAPDILLRNVDLSSTVGIVNAGSETRPFFILRVSSYERTFAGMLGWEQFIDEDLGAFYPPYTELAPIADPTASSTTAATATTTAPPVSRTGFTDAVVANHDVRILRDAFGRSIMLYGYVDKETLVIARDEAAFTALAARLAASAPQQ